MVKQRDGLSMCNVRNRSKTIKPTHVRLRVNKELGKVGVFSRMTLKWIKMSRNDLDGTHATHKKQKPVAWSCAHGNKNMRSVKGMSFIRKMAISSRRHISNL
jgi:hypothetical protein